MSCLCTFEKCKGQVHFNMVFCIPGSLAHYIPKGAGFFSAHGLWLMAAQEAGDRPSLPRGGLNLREGN